MGAFRSRSPTRSRHLLRRGDGDPWRFRTPRWLPVRARGGAARHRRQRHRLNPAMTASDGLRVNRPVGLAFRNCWPISNEVRSFRTLECTAGRSRRARPPTTTCRTRWSSCSVTVPVVTATDTHRHLLPDYQRPSTVARIGGDRAGAAHPSPRPGSGHHGALERAPCGTCRRHPRSRPRHARSRWCDADHGRGDRRGSVRGDQHGSPWPHRSRSSRPCPGPPPRVTG